MTTSEYPFNIMVCPTGFGKSLMYMSAAAMSEGRTLILTSTNPLLHQIISDFEGLCVFIKGKANYECVKIGHGVTCDKGPCNYGLQCKYKGGGCEYYDHVALAAYADIVVTNYAYWIYNNKASQGEEPGIGMFETIICDEAHDCPDKVADAYTVRFSKKNEVERYLLQAYNWTSEVGDTERWVIDAIHEAKRQLSDAKRADRTERAFQAANAARKLKDALGLLNHDSVLVVPNKKYGVLRIALLWPFEKANEVLFCGAKKVVFTSATVRRKTVDMLGVARESCQEFEFPHIIPMHRRMLYHIPCIRLNYKTDAMGMRTWLTKADNIMRSRVGRNGLFHTGSYDRRDYVMKNSRYKDMLITHDRKDTQRVISKFKSPPYGNVLVSPSITTGYDFPYDTARYQIIGKVAWPDMSDTITKARSDHDPEYAPYIAMQTLVQTTGRIVRASDDAGETFIIDDNVTWFLRKYKEFSPGWFHGSYRSVGTIPNAVELD